MFLMKIYMAGNNAISKKAFEYFYVKKGGQLKNRLFSYYEIIPGRFAYRQWVNIKNIKILEDTLR